MRLISPRLAVLVCLFAVTAGTRVLLATPDHPDSFPTKFGAPRVDVLPDGKVVINLYTTGEYKGLLTLNLTPDAAGVYSGDWMIAVRYTDNTDPATGVEPPAETHAHESVAEHERAAAENADGTHPHRDFVRFVDKGVIGGTIDLVSIDLGPDNTLVDLRALLKITVGTLTFQGITGTGMADLSRGLALSF